ncbi:MAG: filamentous hemagglutinin N-terminal domain-containing protein, partial [Gammaproteobacteria bacterium]
MAKGPDKRRASALPAMLLLLIYSPVSRAEITLDGTLGPGGSVTGPDYLIPAEAGERVGGNLFHSFGVFDINTNESATFTGPDPIQNVLGRVTGGSQSNIDGTLRSTMSNADVYLINPAGIVFGENAQLDVQGSFHASTTDYVRLGENGHFAASVQPDASTLTVAPPASFGFLDANLAPITVLAGAVNQPLQVPAGETISLVGGDVVVRGSVLFAPSGRINIASVASPGEVRTAGGGLAVDSFAELGDIRLSQGAIVSANDADEGGGSIVIRGGQLVANNSFVFANTFGDLNGHGINIRLAGDLVLSNGGDIRATTSGAGNAGDIVIAADNLTLLAGAQIDSSSGSAGQAGKLTVNAAGSISISGLDRQRFSSGAFSNTFGDGDANDLSISAGHLKMNDGHVTAGSLGSGSGGDVLIQAGQVTLTNTAAVDSTATSAGPGGDVKIVTSDGMRIVGGPLDATDPTGVFNNANSTGAAGDLTIITDGPLVMRGGRIL